MIENYNSVNLVFMIDTDNKIRSQTKQVSSFSFVRKSNSVCVNSTYLLTVEQTRKLASLWIQSEMAKRFHLY